MVQRAGYPDRVKKYSLLSHATGLSVDRIKLVIAAVERMPVSFHEMVDDEGNVTMDEPKARTDVEESVVVASVGNAIVTKISEMSPLQQVTLALRYFEGLEFQDIANELEVSASSVREAHNEALVVIQTAMVEAISH
jgi:DNA-directed RNA polymerase specialized sigma24 family protein